MVSAGHFFCRRAFPALARPSNNSDIISLNGHHRKEAPVPVIKHDKVKLQPMQGERMRLMSGANVIGQPEGWTDHTLRVFRLAPDGSSPHHSHDWEHVNFVIRGRGRVYMGQDVFELEPGDFAFVPPNTMHQFENPYDEDLEFICIVPDRGAGSVGQDS
jgi:quercetin dioxygenase-like cupin family protein